MILNKQLTKFHELQDKPDVKVETARLISHNQESWQELLAFVQIAKNFHPGFIEINTSHERDLIIEALRTHPKCENLQFVVLNFPDPDIRFLLDEINQELPKILREDNKKLVVIIRGIEAAIGTIGEYPPILADLNYVREAYTYDVPHPLLFCLPDYAVIRISKFAPDFWAWKSGLFRFKSLQTRTETEYFNIINTPISISTQNQGIVANDDYINLLTRLLKEHELSDENKPSELRYYVEVLGQLLVSLRDRQEIATRGEEYLQKAVDTVEKYSVDIPAIIRGHIYYAIGVSYESKYDWETASTYLEEALKQYKQNNDFKNTAATLDEIAFVYEKQRNYQEALRHLQESLAIKERIKDEQSKLKSINQIGIIYIHLGEIEKAIYSFEQLLHQQPRENFPVDWARTQIYLGIAYSDRILGGRSENLETAINCYENALQIYTRVQFPVEWAMTQYNLGVVYSDRILGERSINLELAIECYHNALEVITRKDYPEEWARIKENLDFLT